MDQAGSGGELQRGELPLGDALTDALTDLIRRMQAVVTEVQRPTLGVTAGELLHQVGLLQHVICAAQAAQTVRIAQFAARDEHDTDDARILPVDCGIGHQNEFAGDELAPVLGMAPVTAAQRTRTAVTLVSKLPGTMRTFADGGLDAYRAGIVATLLADADHELCAAVGARVYPRLAGAAPARVRRRVRQVLAELDPLAAAEAAARAVHDRSIEVRPGTSPGMTHWWANLPTADSLVCWAAIDEAAHRMALDDPARTLDQCRADAFVDLVLGRVSVRTTVMIAVPIRADQGAPESAGPISGSPEATHTSGAPGTPPASGSGEPGAETDSGAGHVTIAADFGVGSCDIPGLGTIPAQVVATLLGRFDTRIGRMLVDQATGTTVETTAPRYRPSEAVAAFVRARDGTCRFPGCAARARRCDLDHVIPWPDGPTAPGNLIALCRHHHRLKTHRAWRPVLHLDATVSWTDPYGRVWVTQPADHISTHVA